jgi:hypothetical protein
MTLKFPWAPICIYVCTLDFQNRIHDFIKCVALCTRELNLGHFLHPKCVDAYSEKISLLRGTMVIATASE